ncbi:MAG TPA: AAA family ATPase [Lachnospiraceae bacterium]|nr:AAA family ATPase [Lachnospiraceae bacterium]
MRKEETRADMSNLDSRQYLEYLTEKLKIRIKELEKSIAAGRKDVESMHAYYWENYTEMDEYGYENYDNQQALLGQMQANQEKALSRRRFQRMLDAPFFARVDFRYEGEDEAETFYIGIGNFSDKTGGIPLIYDWRAPVSGLFYDYDQGPASYEAPGGLMEGEITSKWQYKIRNGKMLYGFESDMKIDDEILKQELGTNGDVRLKNIVRTIQKEQNVIIRNTKDRILVIQGAAGSGKTSIALHRIAYLLYHDRDRLRSSDILILSPNSVFSDYISHILPELGEEHIQEMSFDLFAYRELKETVADCEDRYHMLERKIAGNTAGVDPHSEEKQSRSFIGQVEGFLVGLEDRLMEFTDLEYKRLKKTEQELIQLFYLKFQSVPLLLRMEAVMEYVVDEYETLQGKDLSEEEKEEVKNRFLGMYVTRDLYVIYNWLMEEAGYPLLPDLPYEKRFLFYEDVFPMLYLKYRLMGTAASHRRIKHLVVDEMQDYTYLQYVILKELFTCRMTILGDRAQTMEEQERDVMTFLPEIFGKQIRMMEIRKSYRNTVEIAQYANHLVTKTDPEFFERHGKAVEEVHFKTTESALKAVLEQLRTGEGGYETAAILTLTEQEAADIYEVLEKNGTEVSYIDRDSSAFKKGLTVTTWYLAKGLEFDQVFGIWTGQERPILSQAKYICATRALHELYMYTVEGENASAEK